MTRATLVGVRVLGLAAIGVCTAAHAEPRLSARAGGGLDIYHESLVPRLEVDGRLGNDDIAVAAVAAYSHDYVESGTDSMSFHDLALGARLYVLPEHEAFLALGYSVVADRAHVGGASPMTTWRRGDAFELFAGVNVTYSGAYELQLAARLAYETFPSLADSFGLPHGVDTQAETGTGRLVLALMFGFVR